KVRRRAAWSASYTSTGCTNIGRYSLPEASRYGSPTTPSTVPAMPLTRKAAALIFCQPARSSRRTTAIFVSNCKSGESRAHRILVDPVALEAVELLGEEIRRGRRISRGKRRRLAVELDCDEVIRLLVLELHRMPEPGAEPARKQGCLGSRASDADPLHLCDARPQGGKLLAPAARPGPGDVRYDNTVEDPRQLLVAALRVGPLRAVDDQSVDDAEHALERSAAEL